MASVSNRNQANDGDHDEIDGKSTRKSSICFQKTVCLHEWWLVKAEEKFEGKRLAVAGFTSREKQAVRVFSSAPILKRYDVFTLETVDDVCVVLRGFLNKARTKENGFSSEVFSHFVFGFPPHWEVCAEKYWDGGSTIDDVSGSNKLPRQEATVPENPGEEISGKNDQAISEDGHGISDNDNSSFEANENEAAVLENGGSIESSVDVSKVCATPEVPESIVFTPSKTSNSEDFVTDRLSKSAKTSQNVKKGTPKRKKSKNSKNLSDETVIDNPTDVNTGYVAENPCMDERALNSSDNSKRKVKNNNYGLRSLSKNSPIVSVNRGGQVSNTGLQKHIDETTPVKDPKRVENGVNRAVHMDMQKNLSGGVRSLTRVGAADDKDAFGEKETISKNANMSRKKKTTKRELLYGTPLTPEGQKEASVSSLESLGFKKSRSGRLLLPTLEFWRNQMVIYDKDGRISGIKEDAPQQPLRGSKSEPPRKQRQQQS